jgi:hypothetical protein
MSILLAIDGSKINNKGTKRGKKRREEKESRAS